MDQEFAQHLFDIGGFLIVTGLPKGTEIGIDLQSYKSDTKFRGIKMIPPGPHFIYTSSIGDYDDKTSLRVGFIHYFKRQEIVIREWDSEQEQLRERTCGERDIELARIREHIKDLDRYLAPFDFSDFDKWRHLTMHITENIIKCSSPDNGIIKSSADFESCPDSERPRGQPRSVNNNNNDNDSSNSSTSSTMATIAERLVLTPLHAAGETNKQISTKSRITTFDENDYLPRLKIVPGTMPKFTELPKRYHVNATPSEISKSYIDSIDRIDKFMAKFLGKSYTIHEEIQFSYIIFLIGYSVEGLAHWRDILHLLANSELALQKYTEFYRKYFDILKYQLPELPIELMQDSTINPIYKDIRQMLRNRPTSGLLTNECNSLMISLNETMAWSFDGIFDEDPDELPIVVDCGDDIIDVDAAALVEQEKSNNSIVEAQ